jgi:prophage maintenance system killer protein
MKRNDPILTTDEVHQIHREIVEEYELQNGTLLDNVDHTVEKLISILEEENGRDEFYAAARFLNRFLVRSPYVAGNKATGWVCTTVYLSKRGAVIKPKVLEMAPYVVEMAERYTVEELAEWLRTSNISTDFFEEEANAA